MILLKQNKKNCLDLLKKKKRINKNQQIGYIFFSTVN